MRSRIKYAHPAVQARKAIQIGAVVYDAERSIGNFEALLGVGPFQILSWPPDRPGIERAYRGRPGDFAMMLAFADLGPIQLELVQPLRGESIYRDFLESRGEGLHHLLFEVPDIRGAISSLAARGIKVLQSGSGLTEGTMWAYLDTVDALGFNVELRG